MIARHEGRCEICGELIHEGDEIVNCDGEWVHAACDADDEDGGAYSC